MKYDERLTEVYAENPVNHIVSGKAVSRTLNALFLKKSLLVRLLLKQVFDKDMIKVKCFNEQLIEDLQNNDIANKEAFLETELCRHDNDKLEKLKVTLSEESCSAKLQLLYICLHVLKRFIIAERTPNWSLPFSGHIKVGLSLSNKISFYLLQ